MNRCPHCGEPVRGIVCSDYPECVVLKGMCPRDPVPNSGPHSRRSESIKASAANPSDRLPSDAGRSSESEVPR
jgi:hypothetical protein